MTHADRTMKIYKYKDSVYCDEDLSCEYDNYAGDLYDLYLDLKEDNKCGETTRYYVCDKYTGYDEPEELIEEEFSDLVIGEYESED